MLKIKGDRIARNTEITLDGKPVPLVSKIVIDPSVVDGIITAALTIDMVFLELAFNTYSIEEIEQLKELIENASNNNKAP